MKDTVITARRKQTELLIAAGCLIVAVLINVGSIIHYHTPWYEIFTQAGFVVCVALGLYVVSLIIRVLWHSGRRLFGKRA